MSLNLGAQLVSNKSSEVYRLENAEEEDALEEEKAELANKSVTHNNLTLRPSSESFMGGGNRCAKCCTPGRCRHFGLGIKRFVTVDVYNICKFIFLVSGFSFINRGSIRSASCVTHERVRHLSTSPFLIHPFSIFRWLWDIVMIIVFSVYLVSSPFDSAFHPEEYKNYGQWSKPFKGCVILFLDVLLNIRTAVVQPKTNIINLDGRKVFMSYLSGLLIVDLISSFPFDGLYLVLVNHNAIDPEDKVSLKCARMIVISKLLILIRLICYLKRVELSFRLNGLEIRLINLVVIMFIILHWLACAHFLVPDLTNENESVRTNSWVTKMDLWNERLHTKYITSFIRALSHLTLIGFGVEAPIEVEEIYVSMINILVGCVCIPLTLAYSVTLLMSLDVAERQFIEVTKQAGEYMRFKHIPKSLQTRLENYFEQYYRRSFFSEKMVLSSVSQVLRQELLMHTCETLVLEVPLFHTVSRAVIQGIVSRLEFDVYLANDVIICTGMIGDCMYFIEHGTVAILSPTGCPICTLHDGDFFGEMSLVYNEPRAATVIAITSCDIYRLDKVDFAVVVQPYPEIYDAIVKVAESRVTQLDKQNMYKHVPTAAALDKEKPSDIS